MVRFGEQTIHTLVGLGNDIDRGRLTGTRGNLDDKKFTPRPCLEKLLARLALNPLFTAIGFFGGPAFPTWVFVIVRFAMPLHTAALSTRVIALSARDLKLASQSFRIHWYP